MLTALFLAALPALAVNAIDIPDDNRMHQEDGLLRFPLRVSSGAPIVKNVTKRQQEVALEAQLNGNFYSIDLTVGTPGQTVSVNFDTGSPELWINPVCANANDPGLCETFGQFTESSTFVDLNATGMILYGTGYVNFNYSYDFITLGESRISQQVFGLATASDFTNVGIMGASPDLSGWDSQYPLILDNLAKQGFINSRAFSLDIRSIESERGSVLFGGVDTRKFTGRLEKRPIIPAEDSPDTYTRYWVYVDGISIVQDGKKFPILSSPNRQAVVLDSGYTLSTLPGAIVQRIVDAFPSAKPITDSPLYEVDCSVENLNGTVDFAFGDTIIAVPYKDFIWKRPDGLCRLGVFQDDDFPVLGDTFLRAAYVVYDWNNRNVWLANNEDCGSNLVAIGSGPNAVPSLVGECGDSESTSTSTESTVESTTSAASTISTDLSTRYGNATSASTTSASSPDTTGPATVTLPVTTTKVYTVTACPPTVTNCPIGAVTTEVVTSYTTYCPETTKAPVRIPTSTFTSTRVYTITDCPGDGPCNKGEVISEVFTTTKRFVPQTTGTFTIHKTIICRGELGCDRGSTETIDHTVTVTPATENPKPTPIYGCSSCAPNHSSNTVTLTRGHGSSASTISYVQPTACKTCGEKHDGPTDTEQPEKPTGSKGEHIKATETEQPEQEPTDVSEPEHEPTGIDLPVVTPCKTCGDEAYQEPTVTSPAVVTAGAAWTTPGFFAVAVGALIAGMV